MASDTVETGEDLGGDWRSWWNGVSGMWLLAVSGCKLALAFSFGWWVMGFTVDADG